MKYIKTKAIMFLIAFLFIFFFSNDFGIIDIEKTAIVTALAIDKSEEEYEVVAQIAVPEATDTNSEDQKSQVKGSGKTVASAIKNIADISGWYPNLQFCNLIIVGKELTESNVIEFLDYFSKTLRVQDSAIVITTDEKASKLLEVSSPLDSISSFAIQKIILKHAGFDSDVAQADIKDFCIGYYSLHKSSYMPLVVLNKQKSEEGSQDSGGGSGESSSGQGSKNGDTLFNAEQTAMFLNGEQVGVLKPTETMCFNALQNNVDGTTFELENVNVNGENINVLLTILKCKPKIKLKANYDEIVLDVNLKLYCKESDNTSTNSEVAFSTNYPLTDSVIESATLYFKENISSIIEKIRQTKSDILDIKNLLYRKNYKYYEFYKDNYLSNLKYNINIEITGQK